MSARRTELRVRAVLESYPASTIQRAMPIVLFVLAHELGIDGLRPRIKQALFDLVATLDVDTSMDRDTLEAHARSYARTLGIDPQLLRDLEAVFRTMDLGPEVEPAPEHFGLLDQRRPRAAAFDAMRPHDSVSSGTFLLEQTGRIGA